MFLEFYHLRQQPFGVTPDPAYLYPTRTHRDALDSFLDGIKEGRGFFTLIAKPGMGKTTLLYQLLDELHDTARTVFLFQTQCESREFFEYLLNELGVDTTGMGLVLMHSKLNEILFAEMIAGRRFVLIVDEAQNLDDSVLETVRLLSNFETSYAKMLQIVLAGQPELSEKLEQPKLAQLRQRIAVFARLEPLTMEETSNYIDHRLKIAGHSGAPLFTPDAVELIARRTGGTPRSINALCYSALTAAHVLAVETVTAEIVRDVAARLDMQDPAMQVRTEAEDPVLANSAEIHKDFAATAAPAESQSAEESEPPKLGTGPSNVAPRLTYEPVKQFRLPRWAFRAFLFTGILTLAGISLTAFMLRLNEPGQEKNSVASEKSAEPSASAPRQVVPGAVAQTSDKPSSQGTYNADPEESGEVQIITVAAMPGQTLRDISLLYVGRFDPELFRKICALNPELKDPNHPAAGQLVRLPLPFGSFKKGKEFDPDE
jgi:general secretion pathway protein A